MKNRAKEAVLNPPQRKAEVASARCLICQFDLSEKLRMNLLLCSKPKAYLKIINEVLFLILQRAICFGVSTVNDLNLLALQQFVFHK